MATPPKSSRTPAGKPTIQCPECGDWVLLESGIGIPPHRQFTCRQGHRFGMAQAGNGFHAKEPRDAPSTSTTKTTKAPKPSKPKKRAETRDND